MSRLGHYVLGRLHRHIFVWFGATILVTGIVAAALSWLSSSQSPDNWQADVDRLRSFASIEFARTWNDPLARQERAHTLHRGLDVAVHLVDLDGRPLFDAGPPCGRHAFVIPVNGRDGRLLGEAHVCRTRPHGPPKFIWGLFAAIVILWAASGALAKRLTRPLAEVARVAQELGQGHMSARVRLRARHGEVRVVADALNEMAERIERQLKEQRELLAAVSHELRTPLTRTRILVELLREGTETTRAIDELEREVTEMDNLVGQLLSNARVDFQAMSPRSVDVIALAKQALARAGLDESKLQASVAALEVRCDPTLVSRALANLIENAERHGNGLVALEVEAHAESKTVTLAALDDGPGLGADDKGRMFEAFWRGQAGGEKGQLGLGLSLVRRIAQAHGGRAYAENRPAAGARITIELPL